MQYSLRVPTEAELTPEYSLWMCDSPRENMEYEIWKTSWLFWKKTKTKIYEISVINFLFVKWCITKKNENTYINKKRRFPTGMTITTSSSPYGVIVKLKYHGEPVFAGYVLHYIETQRISWLTHTVSSNLHKIHYDQINQLYIYIRKPETRP